MASGSGKEAPKEGDFRMPGLRGAKTTTLFRSVNTELTVRPNNPVMAFGLVTISLCVGYLGYLHATKRTTRSCMTLLTVKGRKTSKWD